MFDICKTLFLLLVILNRAEQLLSKFLIKIDEDDFKLILNTILKPYSFLLGGHDRTEMLTTYSFEADFIPYFFNPNKSNLSNTFFFFFCI